MQYLNKNFLEACKWLADENNLVVSLSPVAEPVEVPKPFDANRYQRFFARPFLSEEARNCRLSALTTPFLAGVRC
jgi:hypothetical protein